MQTDRTEQSIAVALLAQAKEHPDQLALVSDSSMMNFAQLARVVAGIAENLVGRGVDRKSLVAVHADDPLIALPFVLATSLVGSRWIAASNAKHLPNGSNPTHVFRSQDAKNSTSEKAEVISKQWLLPSVKGAIVQAETADPDAPWLHFSTSGTTGTPKILTISAGTMYRRTRALRVDFKPRETVYCGLFPCTSPPYLSFALTALTAGCTIVHSRDFQLWNDAGVSLVHGSLAQVDGLFRNVKLPRKIQQAHVGGAKTPDALAKHLLHSFETLVETYAATETNRSHKNLRRLDQSGNVQTRGQKLDSEVQIVDDTGNLCADGGPGTVRVRNGYLADGYLNNAQAQAAAFRDGWFYPGDIGKWDPNDVLRILGRVGDVINIGGTKVNAAEIDGILLGCNGILDAMCFQNTGGDGTPELLAFVVFEADVDPAEVAQTALGRCAKELGAIRTPDRLVPVHHVPRAEDGGAQRHLCRALYTETKSAM